jgi:hypothetical protein
MGFTLQQVWIMGPNSPPTNLVDQKFYGVWESMGYQGYGYERVDCSKQPKVTKKTAQKF